MAVLPFGIAIGTHHLLAVIKYYDYGILFVGLLIVVFIIICLACVTSTVIACIKRKTREGNVISIRVVNMERGSIITNHYEDISDSLFTPRPDKSTFRNKTFTRSFGLSHFQLPKFAENSALKMPKLGPKPKSKLTTDCIVVMTVGGAWAEGAGMNKRRSENEYVPMSIKK